MVNVAVLGYGTIGSGVVEVLQTNTEVIAQRAGEEIAVKYILDLRDFPGDPNADKIVHDYDIIDKDEDVQVVVECMGGVEPAYTFVKRALLNGRSVATSNKELVAKHGAELIAIAHEKNINFLFEASVGGGIPIIRPLVQCLTADVIEEVSGILNGTTNYMLTRMKEEGISFEEALKEAQEKGYAELHPEADVEGYDACRKIAILTSLAYGMQVDYEDIHTEGITKITATDIKYAKAMDREIKLLATSKKGPKGYTAIVAPFLVPVSHPLYAVSGVFNAIFVHGNVLGDAMFYGSGAGKLPTASAVVADIMEAVENADHNVPLGWSSERLVIADQKTSVHRYFVRVEGTGTELEQAAAAAFGGAELVKLDSLNDEFALLTGEMSEAAYAECAAAFEKTAKIRQRIRAEF